LLVNSFFTSDITLSFKLSFSSKDITTNPYFSKYLNASLLTTMVGLLDDDAICFNSASIFDRLNFNLL